VNGGNRDDRDIFRETERDVGGDYSEDRICINWIDSR
jgi:hypothetical protein